MSADTAAGGLGEMLRSLKERAGLSYGALAGRLHLSTSTLHRYCTGDSVPAEFAPVERFGRICRADPEELLELHRRWAVADEARRGRSSHPAEDAVVSLPVVESPLADAGPESSIRTRNSRQLVPHWALFGAAVVALSASGAMAIDRFRAESVPGETVPAIVVSDPSAEAAGSAPVSVAVVPHGDNCPREGGATTFRVKVRSADGGPVTLAGMDVAVLSAGVPSAGATHAECAHSDGQHPFAVDLDAAEPRVMSPGRGFPYTATAGSPLVLDVTARTSKNDVRWYLDLSWTRGTRSGTLRIDDGGRPFRTGAVK
ncbi:helix-turn-helix transcriptional regulator [Streptomyces bauhiniae]